MSSRQAVGVGSVRQLLDALGGGSGRVGRTPHKYVLLLSIGALLDRERDHPNRFTFQELEAVFAAQFEASVPDWPSDRRQLEYPFYHLQHDGCWHLSIRPGQNGAYQRYQQTRLTRKRLIETVAYGYLDAEVLDGLRSAEGRRLVEERLSMIAANSAQQRVAGEAELHDAPAGYDIDTATTSLFEHEERALQVIESGMPGGDRLLSNVEIHDDQSNSYYEYDVILAARSGLYVVELKHWSGHIRVAPHHWVVDHYRPRRDPHLTNSFKCRLLKGLYEHTFPTFPRLWVESVVVLTNPDATVEGADSPSAAAAGKRHNLTFASIDDFLSYLRKREGDPANHVLSEAEIAAVVDHLRRQAELPRRDVYSVPGYETVQYLFRRPDRIELVGRPLDGRTRGLSRFRVFRLPTEGTPDERARAKRKAYNTLDSVSRIGDHPNIHRVWALPNEEGDVIEVSDWSEAGTLRDLIADKEHGPSTEEALRICRGVALALAAAHEAGIIHRAVKPEHVLMMNGIPKLTDFDLSFHLDREPGDITVLPDPTRLRDDGYTAPELLAGKDIDESTDLFSLGVIAYELLTGAKPFATAAQFVAKGGSLSEQQVGRLTAQGVPAEAIAAIQGAVVADRQRRAKNARQMAEAFGAPKQLTARAVLPVSNAKLKPGDRYDIYEIVEFLGEGAEAQTYRARTIRQEQIALRLFNREVPQEMVLRQQELATAVKSPYVVRSDGRMGHWQQDRFFLVMEYVQGQTLRERIQRGERPAEHAFRKVALGLMDALQAFHTHTDPEGGAQPIVHGDVKPDNILLTPTGEPKLGDLSVAGAPRIDEFAGTMGYVPPDRILGAEMQFAPDGDLFALGVTLWEWLFGTKPYEGPAVGDCAVVPREAHPSIPAGWLRWLQKAVATRAADRFASTDEMREAFEVAEAMGGEAGIPEHTVELQGQEAAPETVVEATAEAAQRGPLVLAGEQDNLFVAYLNTLCSASAGNENATAEAQSHSPFFQRVYVRNPLAELVLQQLLSERHNVILTGNAGDGKTTIAGEVYHKLTGEQMPAAAWTEIRDEGIVIVKDMSELAAGNRTNILSEAARNQDRVHLIVTNTGTLLESARGADIPGLETTGAVSELLAALEADEIVPVLGGRFALLNVGRTDSIETACAVFRRMLEPENWWPCGQCRLSAQCPVWANVQLIRESEGTVVERVELTYRRLYEYGVRLTMRQMIGHLAYALTAGWDCERLRRLSETALGECLVGSLFFNRFFGDDGERLQPEATQLQPVRHVRAAEFGVMLDPTLERDIWARGGAAVPLAGTALEVLGRVRGRMEAPDARARRQARRLVYFFGTMPDDVGRDYLSVFLHSPTLLEYLEIVRGNGSVPAGEETKLRGRVMQVLQEYFAGVRLPEGSWQDEDRLYITLNRRSSGANTQVVLAGFHADEFRIYVRPGHRSVRGSSGRLVLSRLGGRAELRLDLPFLDYVTERHRGEVASQLSAFYADRLERFGAQLLSERGETEGASRGLQLLRIGADRRLSRVRVLFSGERMEVLSS